MHPGDIANAVLDGTDAVMLSAESAIGRNPVATVKILRRVITATQAEYAARIAQTRGCHSCVPAPATGLLLRRPPKLGDACRKAGIDPATAISEIEAQADDAVRQPQRWDTRPVPELIDHIVSRYHEPLRQDLSSLVEAAHKVERSMHAWIGTCFEERQENNNMGIVIHGITSYINPLFSRACNESASSRATSKCRLGHSEPGVPCTLRWRSWSQS